MALSISGTLSFGVAGDDSSPSATFTAAPPSSSVLGVPYNVSVSFANIPTVYVGLEVSGVSEGTRQTISGASPQTVTLQSSINSTHTIGVWDAIVGGNLLVRSNPITSSDVTFSNPTSYSAGWTNLTLTTNDNINSALAVAAAGFTLLLAPGHYYQVFTVPSGKDGWTIRSANTNASSVQLDGRGGATYADNNATPGRGATPLAGRKGVVLALSPGTISDVEVRGGGTNATDGTDSQAGIYFEGASGTYTALRCIIANNNQGIFGNGSGSFNVTITGCLFRDNGLNEITFPGFAHDTYILGSSTGVLTLTDNTFIGNKNGNNSKSRIGIVNASGGYNTSTGGRWIEGADGAAITISGGTYIGTSLGANVFGDGTESLTKHAATVSWTGGTIWVANRSQDFYSAGTFNASGVTVLFEGPSSIITNSHGGALTGLTLAPSGSYNPKPTVPTWVPGVLPSLPNAPTSPAHGTATSTTMPLSWSAPSGGGAVDFYKVQYRVTGTTPWSTATAGTVTGLGYTVTGLTPSTGYDFSIIAQNAAGDGARSTVVTGTTAAGSAPSVTPFNIGVMVHGGSEVNSKVDCWIGFKRGDFMPSTMHLVATYASNTIQVQHNMTSLYSDGSCRQARICFYMASTLSDGVEQLVLITPTAGAQTTTPHITPLALATAADFRLKSYGADAAADCTVSLLDIVTNSTQDTWGTNPLQGWDVPISGPNEVMIRAWSYKKLTGGSTYHKWHKVVIYASKGVDGGFEVTYLNKNPNWDIAVPGGTIGDTVSRPESCYYEAYNGATRLFAWGGPNDVRATVMPVSSIGSNGSWTPPAKIIDYQAVQFTAASGGTLPTGITSGRVYYVGGGRLHYNRNDLLNFWSTDVPLSVSGGSGNMNVIPVVACYYGQANCFLTNTARTIRVGSTRLLMTVAPDEAYMSNSARMFPRYDQSSVRPASSATDMQFINDNLYPNYEPYGSWLSMTGDNPGDERIGYIDYVSSLSLLKPHDVNYHVKSIKYAAGFADQQIWWENPRTGRIFALDNGPDNAGASYSQLGAPHPYMSINGGSTPQEGWLGLGGGGGLDNYAGYTDGYSSAPLDTSHMPAPWIVPAFKTGHPMFADIGRAQAQAAELYINNRTYSFGGPTYYGLLVLGQQLRGIGWLIRAYDYAEGFTPSSYPEAPYIKNTLDQTAAFLSASLASETTAKKNIGAVFPQNVDPYFQPWMVFVMGTAMALQAAKGDRPNWLPYLRTMANYSAGIVNDASPTGGSGFFLSGGHYAYFYTDDNVTPHANIRALIAYSSFLSNSVPPYPTAGFTGDAGGIKTLFRTNGGFPWSTTDYSVTHLAFLATLKSLNIISDNGDSCSAVYDAIMTRITTPPETGIKYGDTANGGSLWGGARSVHVFGIIPYT